jgi:hypothetical protein
MKLAIVIATYMRKNNSSPKNIRNVFKMLRQQTYKDFKVFIVGDCYENNEEFENLCDEYNDDIYYKNLDKHFRNNYFNIRANKWASGGCNARYHGIKKAFEENYDYYLHLDDDDIWLDNHVSSIVETIKAIPKLDFAFTYGKLKNYMLPREYKSVNSIYLNNLEVKHGDIIHSSWCINLNTMFAHLKEIYDLRLNTIDKIQNGVIPETRLLPLDYVILTVFRSLNQKNKCDSVFIPKFTVIKDTEGNIPE